MTDRVLLKLALEALENPNDIDEYNRSKDDLAITALRERLAQPEQEPELSCGVDYADGLLTVSVVRAHADESIEIIHCEQIAMPIAEQPAQQQEPVAFDMGQYCCGYAQIKDGEYKLFSMRTTSVMADGQLHPIYALTDEQAEHVHSMLTSPPANANAGKPWVGLTDVEWMNIVNKNHAWFGHLPEDVAHEVVKLVEAKLRGKNTCR